MRQQGRSIAVITLVLCASGVATARVAAQDGRGLRGTDAVRLLVRPRVGDTLHLQMEQTIEMSRRVGERTDAAGSGVIDRSPAAPTPRAPEIGPRRALPSQRLTRLVLFAHSLVEASDLASTTLLATTDSMAMWAGNSGDSGTPQRMPVPSEGRQVRVRVTPEGAMRVNDPPPGALELGSTLASMPGMLPDGAVRIGDVWERDIPLPSVPVSGFRADGVVRARFRFDSLTRRGRDAWISMDGTLRRDGAARDLPPGSRVITAGTMRGVLVVDRERAWIVDARTVIDVQSDVSPGAAAPVLLDIRIQQRVRVR
jgi:hypothetical protein